MKWLLLVSLVSCATYNHGALIEQELRFRPGYKGLTHAVNDEFLWIRYNFRIVEYDFLNPADLRRLREIKLVCKVGERRFHVCADRPGLCSNFKDEKTFLGIPLDTELQSEVLGFPDDLQVLIDTNTYCAAQGSISETGMF